MVVGPVIIVAGPTASGKSRLGLELAKQFRGSVVNADSLQVYRELKILTNRPSKYVERIVPHHLYGVVSASKRCSVGWWRRKAQLEIEQIASLDCVPIFVGGTGLYINAFINGIACIPNIPIAIRAEGRQLYQRLGGKKFRERLVKDDAETANRLYDGDKQRLIRAWEVFTFTGRRISQWQADGGDESIRYPCFVIKIMPRRDHLYEKCNVRFADMMARGALDEVVALGLLGLDPSLPAMKAIGVSELLSYLDGDLALEAACQRACQATRNYAKRQYTWFRNQLKSDIEIVDPVESYEEVVTAVTQFLLTSSQQPTSVARL